MGIFDVDLCGYVSVAQLYMGTLQQVLVVAEWGRTRLKTPRPCLLEEAVMELLCGPLHIRITT